MQPRGGYSGGSYGRKGRQITWRAGSSNKGYWGPSAPIQNQTGPRRDPNAMDVNKERGGDRTCYMCRKWGYMAKNCWERWKKGRIVEMPQESAKDNRTVSSQLASNNLYSVLCPEKLGNKLNLSNTTERVRDMWCTLWPLWEVWMKVELEKLENHEGMVVKALLDSGATDLFIDTAFAREKGFKMEKLKNPLLVRNVNGTANVGGAIMYQVECNMFFKGHVERVRIDVCNLGKMGVILEMP